jgi:cyclic pyranopterin phosphate synthase
MPHDEYEWTPKAEILRYEEMGRLARLFVDAGVEKIRLTGGEPLVRQDLGRLIESLAAIEGLRELSLTTNAALLTPERAHEFAAAGLRRINISLDSLRPERFTEITRRGDLMATLSGIEAAKAAGLGPIKLNAVVVRGVNDDEIMDLFEFALAGGHLLRFIEYMDVGHAHGWSRARTVTQSEIMELLAQRGVRLRPAGRVEGRAPAEDFVFEVPDGFASAGEERRIGIIASVSRPFCGSCTRARLTADGRLVTCLFAADGIDLRSLLRSGADDDELSEVIRRVWSVRRDRHSEERLEALLSENGYDPDDRDKLEMIRLGG